VNAAGATGMTVLHFAAARSDRPELIALLLAAKADPNQAAIGRLGTPLETAKQKGCVDVVKQLQSLSVANTGAAAAERSGAGGDAAPYSGPQK
jgi:ankyrin repeat protein